MTWKVAASVFLLRLLSHLPAEGDELDLRTEPLVTPVSISGGLGERQITRFELVGELIGADRGSGTFTLHENSYLFNQFGDATRDGSPDRRRAQQVTL